MRVLSLYKKQNFEDFELRFETEERIKYAFPYIYIYIHIFMSDDKSAFSSSFSIVYIELMIKNKIGEQVKGMKSSNK